MRIGAWAAGLCAMLAGAAWAEDRALILGNADYAAAPGVSGARNAMLAAPALRSGGFATVAVADQTAEGLRRRLSEVLATLAPGDRLVIVLAGHFAQGGGETWFLGTAADGPDLPQAGAVGVELSAVLGIAAELPGQAVVLLGGGTGGLPLGRGLSAGIGRLDVPQGVAVIRGPAATVADFAVRQLTRREVPLQRMLAEGGAGLSAEGFLPATAFRPAAVAAPAPVPTPPRMTDAERAEEDRTAEEARRAATVTAWRGYLTRYPAGRYAAEARAEIARIEADPLERARTTEEALGLTRDQRRTIQRQLGLMGFDPRGVDGLFGAGSRAAILAWQQANGEVANGFLTRDQILRLAAQAERRAAENAAAEAARRAEAERQDRLWWEETGAKGDEAGLRAYLNRYPRGLYAELAQARLAALDATRAEQAEAAAWDRARRQDTPEGYRAYLEAHPAGRNAARAQARLAELAPPGPDLARAEAAETALDLGPLGRTLVERRLAGLGFPPGPVDGNFDAETRRAIRAFQAARGLPETGFVDQTMMVTLMAGVLRTGP